MRRIVCSAPARANLIGNPSDQYGGCTLACTLPLRARVILEEAEEGAPTHLVGGGLEATLADAADLAPQGDALDLARAVLRSFGGQPPAAHLAFETDIPRQSGVAGSTALVAALLRVLLAWRREPLHAWALAERARVVEADGLGVQCGYVDQYATVFGGLRFVDLRGKAGGGGAPGEGAQAPLATVEDLGPHVPELPFVVAFSGVQHSSGQVHAPIRKRWLAGEPDVLAAYERITALGQAGKRALLDADWARLGELMNENHAIQRDLGGSGLANEKLIAAARAAGARGAKLAGAGGGGTVVVLWPGPSDILEAALREAGAVSLARPALCDGVKLEEGRPAAG